MTYFSTTGAYSYDAVNPPIPKSQQKQSLDTSGQRLQSLLKTWEKNNKQKSLDEMNGDRNKDDDTTSSSENDVLEEIVSTLQHLTIVVQRQGLLRQNTTMAKHILDSTTIAKQQQQGNKKKRRNFTHLQQQSLDDTTSTTATTTTVDAQLLMLAMLRIIENHPENKNVDDKDIDTILIHIATTDLITASCQYIIQQQQQQQQANVALCFLAEYELLAASSKSLLNGIEHWLRPRIFINSTTTNETELQGRQQQKQQLDNYSIVTSFRAATSIVALLGNKLFTSRNSSSSSSNTTTTATTLQKLQELAWNSLLIYQQHDDAIFSSPISLLQTAATTFITTLPSAVAGATTATTNNNLNNNANNNITSSMSRNQTWIDATTALAYTVQQKLQVDKNSRRNEVVTDTMTSFVKQIILPGHHLKPTRQHDAINDENRTVNHFLQIIQSLVAILVSLLNPEGTATSSNTNCEINIDMLLNIIDGMLSVPASAENKYYSTKKRLRNESITSGLLFSPLCIATKIALPIRLSGHVLFNATVASLGSMNLLPFVRRIIKTMYQTLVSSSSMTVRFVTDPTPHMMMFGLDPTTTSNSNTNKRGERWLHTSMMARTATIESFQYCIQTFGVDIQPLTPSTSNNHTVSNRNNHVESTIRIICATMIEEFSVKHSSQDIGDTDTDWGTWNDRFQVVATIALCLSACLKCGGSFLSPPVRTLIDMVSTTSLSSIGHNHPITQYGEVKSSILKLGIAVLCTPWQDGATSTIATELISAAQCSARDSNEAVVATATTALNMCYALQCSRIPPLHVITRSNDFLSDNSSSLNVVSAETIEDKLRKTRDDMRKMKAISDENTKASALKKSKQDPALEQIRLNIAPTFSKPSATTPTIDTPLPEMDEIKKDPIMTDTTEMAASTVDIGTGNDPIESAIHETTPLLLDTTNIGDDDDFPMIVDCGPDEDDE